MQPSVEQIVRDYREASEKLRRETNTPEKARALLVKIGVLVEDPKAPNGVRPAAGESRR